MPRGQPNQIRQNQMVESDGQKPKTKGLESRLRPTGLNHIFFLDIEGDGRLREVAVVKLVKDQTGSIQTIRYIDIATLDNVDKGRLKSLVTNQHADKYELWDLMSQTPLNNGKNALDYFHQLTRHLDGPGATNTSLGGGLLGVTAEGSTMIGSQFTDPGSATMDPAN